MSWIPSSLLHGVKNLFTGQSGDHKLRIEYDLEDIREAMLNGLDVTSGATVSKLELKVTHASNLQDLWYLRGDVMEAIAAISGEAQARRKLDEISAMFRGLLPKAQMSRPNNFR